jgi:hypothetical protein
MIFTITEYDSVRLHHRHTSTPITVMTVMLSGIETWQTGCRLLTAC